MDYLLIAFCILIVGPVLAVITFPFWAHWAFQPGEGEGDYVAEVWLEWSICRGSTMYRQRFKTQKEAYNTVRFYARILDSLLPSGFMTTDREGRRIRVSNDMGIKYGVRPITEEERQSFRVIWSTAMPGDEAFQGEHPSIHPVVGDHLLQKASETASGVKL